MSDDRQSYEFTADESLVVHLWEELWKLSVSVPFALYVYVISLGKRDVSAELRALTVLLVIPILIEVVRTIWKIFRSDQISWAKFGAEVLWAAIALAALYLGLWDLSSGSFLSEARFGLQSIILGMLFVGLCRPARLRQYLARRKGS